MKRHRWMTRQSSNKGHQGISRRRVHLLRQGLALVTNQMKGVYLRSLEDIPMPPWHSLGTAGSVPHPQRRPSTSLLIALMKIVTALVPVRAAPPGSFPNRKHPKLRLRMILPSACGCAGSASLPPRDSCYSSQQSQSLGNEVRALADFQSFHMAAWPQIALPT